jgi:hypothetical protein
MIEHCGVTIGVLGLIEREWLDTLTFVRPCTRAFLPYLFVFSLFPTLLSRPRP